VDFLLVFHPKFCNTSLLCHAPSTEVKYRTALNSNQQVKKKLTKYTLPVFIPKRDMFMKTKANEKGIKVKHDTIKLVFTKVSHYF
jgi:transcriptional regulator